MSGFYPDGVTPLPAFYDAWDRPPVGAPAPNGAPAAFLPDDPGLAAYLAKICDGVVAAANGTRNQTLNGAAYTLGRIVAAGQLDTDTATAALAEAARSAGLGEGEAAATIRSGLTGGSAQPRALEPASVPAVTTLGAVDRPVVSERRLVLTPASQIRPERQRWLWTDRIPLDALCLLAGREGLGKSTIAVDVASQVTRGQLAGELHGQPRDVLIVATEDNLNTTIVPRLIAAGADLGRVHFVTAAEDGLTGQPSFPLDTGLLGRAVEETKAGLVILDACTSVIDGRLDGDRDRQMRSALEPLGRLAAAHGAAVLGIVHFGKRADSDTGKLILGSIAWSQVARAVLAVARDEDSGHLLVQPTKHNLGPGDTPAIAARLVPAGVATDDGMTSVGRVEWLGETDTRAIDLLGRRHDDPDERSERDEAAEWLRSYLDEAGGSAPAADIKAAASRAGIAERTLTRARQRVGVTSERSGFGKGALYTWSHHVGHMEAMQASAHARGQHGQHVAYMGPAANPPPPPDLDGPQPCGHPAAARTTDTGRCALCIAAKHNTRLRAVEVCPTCGTELLPDGLCLSCAAGGPHVA